VIDRSPSPPTSPAERSSAAAGQDEVGHEGSLERRLGGVLEVMGDAVTVQDASGRVVFANAAAASLMGLADAAAVIATPPSELLARWELFDPSDQPLDLATLPGRAVLGGRPAGPIVIKFRDRVTNETRYSRLAAAALPGRPDEPALVVNVFEDVTEQMTAERSTRASAERSRQLAESLPTIAWSADSEGRVTQANRRWTEYLGTDPGEAGMDGWPFVHPADVPELSARWQAALAGPGRLEATARLRRADGADRWHLVRAEPLLHPDGTISGWVGTATDIHDRSRAETANRLLAEATRRLEEGLDVTSVAEIAASLAVPELADWCVVDIIERDGEVRRAAVAHADPADEALAAELRRYPIRIEAETAGGRARRDGPLVLSPLTEHDRVAGARDAQHLAIAHRLGSHTAALFPLTGREGLLGRITLQLSDPRRTLGAEDVALGTELARRVSLALDNARRHEAERAARQTAERAVADAETALAALEAERARLAAVVASMPVGVLLLDAASERVVTSNEQASRVLGRPVSAGALLSDLIGTPGADPAGGRATSALPSGQSPPNVRAAVAQAIAERRSIADQEIELDSPDGAPRAIEISTSPIVDHAGSALASVVIVADVTERRRARDTQQFLVEASALLSSSLDVDETARRLAALAVPGIADWCAIELIEPGIPGTRLAAIAHVDPSKVALARRLREDYPADPESTSSVQEVIRTGRSVLVADIPPEVIEDAAVDADHRAMLQALELRSYMSVPLVAGGHALGAISFVGAESGRRFNEADLSKAEELASRAAAALENARLFRDVARFKQILDVTLDPVFMFEPHSLRFSYVNRGAAEQLGMTQDELLTLGPADIAPSLDPARLRAMVDDLVSGRRGSVSIQLSLRRRRQRPVPVDVLFQYVTPTGEPGQIFATARDITDRVDAQARLQRLAEAEHARAAELHAVIGAIGEAVLVCDPEGRIRLANPAAEALLAGLADRTYEALRGQFDDPRSEAPALGDAGGPVVLRLGGPEEHWLEVSTYPVMGGPGVAPGSGGRSTIVLARDVTRARQRQAVRDTFLHVLSHELRTPITTIYGGAKVLARSASGLDPAVRQELFVDIHEEAERLHRLVEDVIALTRFGEDEGEMGSEPLLIQRILPQVVASEEARWPGVEFRTHLAPGLPTVVAERTYTEQVIRNLLSNAAKYSGPGSHVEVHVEAGGHEVFTRILDDGPGFPADEAERLFERFYRSPSTARAAAGAGIGLFVCARLVGAMGGRIWARPRDEGGAEFAFALPVMAEDDE
jgi:PAS domain S-box-containing protein